MRIRRTGLVPRMREIRYVYKILFGKPERRYHLKDLGVHWRIILESILEK